jgi:uncharacterized protein
VLHTNFHRWLLMAAVLFAPAGAGAQVVISQVFGGGGNSGAPYTHDFVEIFNRGHTSVDITGWSLQFGAATGTTTLGSSASLFTLLSGILQPGQFMLIRGASGGTAGLPLPTPDVIDPTPPSIAATSGKVALVRHSSPLGTTCPTSASFTAAVADFAGFGTSNCWEGFAAAPAASNTRAVMRADGGCADTNDNATDFVAAVPLARNGSSPLQPCPVALPPAIVPEPRTLALVLAGFPFVVWLARRQGNQMCRFCVKY